MIFDPRDVGIFESPGVIPGLEDIYLNDEKSIRSFAIAFYSNNIEMYVSNGLVHIGFKDSGWKSSIYIGSGREIERSIDDATMLCMRNISPYHIFKELDVVLNKANTKTWTTTSNPFSTASTTLSLT